VTPPYHPRAYISGIRNVNRGLASRSKILEAMEEGKIRLIEISEKSGLKEGCVSHHLKLLLKQKVVSSATVGRGNRWTLTHYGQERLG
jgi:predicted ArsR family transcriptional regulator